MEVPFNGAPKRPGSPSPLTSPAHSTTSRGGLLQSCCGRCYPQRYQQAYSQYIPATRAQTSSGQPGGGQTGTGVGTDDTYLVEASF
ncbi:PREDICTED: potassium voltage-gated channel protein Shal-like [Ceratosolen solmsi marchali]|uniref:Potassium voltage-gated channel protein Shal-like n=1 Tax=Ceratosolen solmsi marchali TaxID=326594 RepID=A0AAJ7DUR9_9HYME|nr:PREDICTED: potassium voltage-gated channel protein Shal-like [Ceratosolen solmsi marchali]